MANIIASKGKGIDKYSKHVADGGRECCRKHGRGSAQSIKSRTEYRTEIVNTMKAADTQCFRGVEGDFYYREKTNFFVFVDRKNPERSTAYAPKKEQAYFQKQVNKTNEARHELGQAKVQVVRGGYPTLMKQQEQIKKQKIEAINTRLQKQIKTTRAGAKDRSKKR